MTGGMSGAVLPGGGCPGEGFSSGPRRALLLSVSERVSQYAARRLSGGLRVPSAEGGLRGAGASPSPWKWGSDTCRGSSGCSGDTHMMGTINMMPG